MSNKEIQSRRDFFKSAAKKALPIAGLLITSNAIISQDTIKSKKTGCEENSCDYLCRDTCISTCTGTCDVSCYGTCMGSCHVECTGSCPGVCKDACTSCAGTCKDSCKQTSTQSQKGDTIIQKKDTLNI